MVLRKSAAVVVVCHPGYSHFARACVEAVNRQTLPFTKKVFVWDGSVESIPFSLTLFPDWRIVISAGGPNVARNLGLQEAFQCEWIVFWDADNMMPVDYHAQAYGTIGDAPQAVGVCYPDVHRVDGRGKIQHKHKMPEWSHRAAQARSIADSASFWRVEAVCEVGGFDESQVRHDDFTLSLRVFRAGWKGRKLPAYFNHLSHGKNRSTVNDITDSLFIAYHFAFVTLWGGGNTEVSRQVLEWLMTAEIPPSSMLYWVDNSGGKMRPLLHYYADRLRDRFVAVTIIEGGAPYKMQPGEAYKNPPRHKHVAYLYNMVLPMIREEIVCFIEDDNIPPLDGVRKLLRLIQPNSSVAVAASVYRSRPSPAHICASRDKTLWRDVPVFNALPTAPFEVGMTGLGFALVANWALQECLPVFCELTEDGRLMGWDGNLGLALTARGYKLFADPSVRCSHLCAPVIEWERCHPKPPCPPNAGYDY